MKTTHPLLLTLTMGIFLGVIGLISSGDNIAYGLWVRQSPQELLEQSSTIFVGNITSVNVLQFEKEFIYTMEENGIEKNIVKNYTLNLDEYKVDAEEFLKNPQNANKITVRQPVISSSPGQLGGLDKFQVGDRVLFYVKNLDGNNTYSPESFIIPKSCIATDVLTQKRLESRGEWLTTQNGMKVDSNFTANTPIQFGYHEDTDTLFGKSIDVMVSITKNTGSNAEIVFKKEIHAESKPCEWITSTEWEFTPQEGQYRMDVSINEDNKTEAYSVAKFSVKPDMMTPNHISPLRQLQSGIKAEDVQCNQGLQLIIKTEDGVPSCVKHDTATKLVARGWSKIIFTIENTNLNTLSENGCGQFYTAPENQDNKKVPILLMNSNSTGCARFTFTIIYNYHDTPWPRIANFPPLGIVGNTNHVTHGDTFSTTPGKDFTNSFHIVVMPQTVDLANYPIGSNFTVTYVIKPLLNATGFYDHSIPKLACESYPLAIGYAANQVNYSDFSYIDPLNPPCVSGPYKLTAVEISGMNYKQVELGSHP